jgi:hypothetical protein
MAADARDNAAASVPSSDVLLYDLTSSYVEGAAEKNPILTAPLARVRPVGPSSSAWGVWPGWLAWAPRSRPVESRIEPDAAEGRGVLDILNVGRRGAGYAYCA